MSQRDVSVGILHVNALCLRHQSADHALSTSCDITYQFLSVIYDLCSSFSPDHKFQMEYYDRNRLLVWKH